MRIKIFGSQVCGGEILDIPFRSNVAKAHIVSL